MRWLAACVVWLSPSLAQADSLAPKLGVHGAHHGYVFDVAEEKNRRDIEMVMLEEPKKLGPPIKDVIVNEQLSREFQRQYEYRFGQTNAEQIINSPGRTDQYLYFTGRTVTLQEYQLYQRQFAEYMGRRLTEYHVDNWAKKDRSLRNVVRVKDRISNVDVQTKSGYKFKWRYNLSGPNMDFVLENPYEVETRVRVEMSGLISAPVETILTLGYSVNPRVRLTGLYRNVDGLYQVVASRRMTRRLSTSLTGSVDTRKEGPTIQQNLFLVGLSWTE